MYEQFDNTFSDTAKGNTWGRQRYDFIEYSHPFPAPSPP
jgi:hypothetical protein